MAHLLETQIEGRICGESELVSWLKHNSFNEAIPIFKQENITLNELILMGQQNGDYLRQYLFDINIPKSLITRITFKIKAILTSRNINNNNDDNNEQKEDILTQNIVRIVISQEEEDAINKLKKYENNISHKLQHLLLQNETMTQNENKIKSEINANFNHLINSISNKQQEILKTIETIKQKNQRQIQAKCQILQQQQEITRNVVESCENMLHNQDQNLYRNERKKQILSVTNDILNQKQTLINDNSTADTINYKYHFNQQTLSSVKTHTFLYQFTNLRIILFFELLQFLSRLAWISIKVIPKITNVQTVGVTNNECIVK